MRVIRFHLQTGLNEVIPGDNIALRLVYLNDQDGKVVGWFEESYAKDPQPSLFIYLALTGEEVPVFYTYITSHQVSAGGGYFVVHAFNTNA